MSKPTSVDIRTLFLKAIAINNQKGDFSKEEIAIADGYTAKINRLIVESQQQAIDYFAWRIDCSTAISELYGWKGCVDTAKDQTEKHLKLTKELGDSEAEKKSGTWSRV